MTHDAGSDLDHFELQAGQRPAGHRFRQFDATQEVGQIVGQRVQLQPHLVVAEPLAGQPRPVEGILALLDVLLGRAALIVEPHHPIRVHRQVGDDEAHAGEQLARMPFDLGNHPAWLVPALRLILEVLVEPLDLDLRGVPDRPGQLVRDLLAQDIVGGQPDGVEIACLFQTLIDRGVGLAAVRPFDKQFEFCFEIPSPPQGASPHQKGIAGWTMESWFDLSIC